MEIGASHEDYGERKMGWERQAGDIIPASYTFKLGNGIVIGGRVVDEGDAPIAGATVSGLPGFGRAAKTSSAGASSRIFRPAQPVRTHKANGR